MVNDNPVILEVNGLTKTYGVGERATRAIGDLTFSVVDGEFLCIVGPSGCGKTTLLKCLSGLIRPTAGTAKLAGTEISGPSKRMAVVFQDYSRSLLPWLTVRKNVTLPLRAKGMPRTERNALAEEMFAAVGLSQFMDHYPWQLSGGMQQRVAIARALAYQADVLLMDEPFAAVDAQTRADLEDLTLRIWSEFKVTVLLVTHDIDEAVYLADRIVALAPAPTEVKQVIDIGLPRPRDQVKTKELPEFVHLRAHAFRLIKQQVDDELTLPAAV